MDDKTLETPEVVEGQLEEMSDSDAVDSPESTEVAVSSEPQSQAELVVSLTNLINANLNEIQNLEKEMSKHKEMVDNVLANDETYIKHAEAAKEASRIKGNTKKEIFKRPDVKHVVEKLTELKDEVSATKEELSNYIQEYASASGQNYFESEDGTIQEIVYVAKLRRKAA
jgi:ribosomal protein S8